MDKRQTFAELGIPFRLYEAPIETCSIFQGKGECRVCHRHEQWVFRAGIGDDLLVTCSQCGETNALDCDHHKDAPCTKCQSLVPWPLKRGDKVSVCYDCLRAGRVWFTQDTALGMVRWEDVQRGWSHGLPGDMPTDARLNSRFSETYPNWREFALHPDDASELGRTPSYTTWQGERWPFHCGRTMIYIGEPMTRARDEAAPEVAAAAIRIIEEEGWDTEGIDVWNSTLCAYVFRCSVCGALDGHADAD